MFHIPGKQSCSLRPAQGLSLNFSCRGSASTEGETGHGCCRDLGDKGKQTEKGESHLNSFLLVRLLLLASLKLQQP